MQDSFIDTMMIETMLSWEHDVDETFYGEEKLGFEMELYFRKRNCYFEVIEDCVTLGMLLGIAPRAYPRVFKKLTHWGPHVWQEEDNSLIWGQHGRGTDSVQIARLLIYTAEQDLRATDALIECMLVGADEALLLKNIQFLTVPPHGGYAVGKGRRLMSAAILIYRLAQIRAFKYILSNALGVCDLLCRDLFVAIIRNLLIYYG